MRRNTTLLLLLCSLFLLGSARPALADDNLTFKIDAADGTCCWSFSVTNGGPNAITEVQLTFTNIGTITFGTAMGPGVWGEADYSSDFRSISYKLPGGGTPLQPGQTLSGFFFCHDGTSVNDIDKPVRITWKTLSLGVQQSTGVAEFICTDFQSLSKLDTVSVTSTKVGTDPVYNFTVMNRNKPALGEPFDIGKMVFEMITLGAGTVRPALAEAPAGWTLDSVTPTRAYFSTLQSPIEKNQNLSGFKVGLRSSANTTKVTWVWRALTLDGGSIDRDTLRNVTTTAETGAPSDDQVTITKQAGCLYSMSVANMHNMNLQPPSRITEVRLVSKTPGVTFTAAPTKPAGWGASIKSGSKDTVFYKASNEATAIPSGITSSDFAFSVDNPAGSTFNLEWQTIRNGTIISSGSSLLSCVVEAPKSDVATITQVGQTCEYTMDVLNQHNSPASTLSAVGVSVPAGSGKITGIGSGWGWTVTKVSETAFIVSYPAGSENVFSTGLTQTITFSIAPKDASQPLNVTWATYEGTSPTPISTGTQALQCTPTVEAVCDSIKVSVLDASNCAQQFAILNQRIENEAVTSVTITPSGGWFVDSAQPVIGWQRAVASNGAAVTYTGTLDAGISIPLNLNVRFNAAQGTTTAFDVQVTTLGANNTLTCNKTVSVSGCTGTAGIGAVTPRLQSQMKLTVSPNPATAQTSINYFLPQQGRVAIAVIDILGNTQKTIFSGLLGEGAHNAQINASDLPNGSYYVRVETSYGTITKQLIINR
jgi:hypothetical protein